MSGRPALLLFGLLCIGATYAAGARFGARVGWASALVTAASPVFLLQFLQMNSIAAAALWMLVVASVTTARPRGPALGGLAAGAAGIVGPTILLPLAIPPALFLLLRPERAWRERVRAAATFAVSAAPGAAAAALIQYAVYGSVLSSGPASIEGLFSVDAIAPNAIRYATWLSETQTPVWVVAGAAPFLLPGALTRLFLGMFFVNLACYLPYVVTGDWFSLRFLLPTIPLLMILVVASIDSACRRVAPWVARPVVFATAIALAWAGVRQTTNLP